MSSKTKTENLQLNQWALDDVFQMSDFNSDNAKIDAAITSAQAEARMGLRTVKLMDAVPEANKDVVSLDFTGAVNSGKYISFLVIAPRGVVIYMDDTYNPNKLDFSTGLWSGTGIARALDGTFKIRFIKDGSDRISTYITAEQSFAFIGYSLSSFKLDVYNADSSGTSCVYTAGDRIRVFGLEDLG